MANLFTPVFLSPKPVRFFRMSQSHINAIDCIEFPDLGEVKDAETIGQLAEIAENLHRREITALVRGS